VGRKARFKYGVQEIAAAGRIPDARVVKDINAGALKYEDLGEVSEYVVSARNPFIGELLKAGKKEEPF